MTDKPAASSMPPPTVGLVAKTFEDGGKHFTAISVTFLLACLYVMITVASTTHRQLLLGGTLKLPILDVSIPLRGFYVVAPIVILGLHLHILLQNHVLVRRLRHQRIHELGGDEDFFLFPALPVLHQVLQPKEPQVARLVWVGLWMINVMLPLAVLCLAQWFFLPYHSFWITLCHQAFIVIDLVIAWSFLVVLLPVREKQGHRWTRWRAVGVVVAVLVLFYSFILAVVPGTWIERRTGKHRLAGWVPRTLELAEETLISEPPPPELLAASVATGEDRELAFYRYAVGASLAGRDLRGANLEGAKLFKADLRGADLTEARLGDADLRGANLSPLGPKTAVLTQERGVRKSKDIAEEIRKGSFKPTRLDRAELKNARFDDANLILVHLSQADLRDAHLAGVEMTGARLRGALLQGADLAGAELSHARMERADLTGAHAEGATFDHASLAGASLDRIEAPAASFVSAHLEGTRLTEAVLKAGDFYGAALAGSDFRRAFLQGASSLRLEATDLRGAHLGGICETSVFGLTDLRSVEFGFLSPEDWQALKGEVIEKLRGRSEEEIKTVAGRVQEASERKRAAVAQGVCLGTLLSSPAAQRNLGALYLDTDQDLVVASVSPLVSNWNEAAYHKELAEELLEQACKKEGLDWTVALRAAGEYGPGDRELDLELARQLLIKLRDPSCDQLRVFPQPLKQQIAWRLRKRTPSSG